MLFTLHTSLLPMARFVLTPASAPAWTLKSANNRQLFNVLQDKRVEFQWRNSTLLSICFFDAVCPKHYWTRCLRRFALRGFRRNIGIANAKTRTEKSRPLMEPTAKENQNRSSGPSVRNGIKPQMVDSTVSRMGVILWFQARR